MDESVIHRFWKYTIKKSDEECWEWTGSVHPSGHGQMSSKRGETPFKAHRVSFLIHKGSIPDGLNINHHCDNPSCVNPAHLYAGTQQQNMKDVCRRHRNPNCSLTQDQVKEIKDKLVHRKYGDITAIAKEYGISFDVVYDIARKRTYNY